MQYQDICAIILCPTFLVTYIHPLHENTLNSLILQRLIASPQTQNPASHPKKSTSINNINKYAVADSPFLIAKLLL